MFGLTFLRLLICFAASCATNVCVSSLRFGSGLRRSWVLGGLHVGLCGSGSYHCSLLEVPIFVCWFFSVAAELCILSSCWGCGRLLLSLFLVCLLSNLPGAPAVFCFVSGSWRPFWGSTPRCLRLADLLLRWGFRVGFGGFLLQISCYPTLVFYLVPAQLPLRCFPFGVLRPCRVRRHV